MQPQQPYYPPGPQPSAPPPNPSQQPANPYEFITNPSNPPQKNITFGGNSMKQRILVVLGGISILIILFIIFMNLISGGNGDTTTLTSIAQQQNEISRVASIGIQSGTSQSTKNFAVSAQLGLATDEQELVNYVAKHGKKLSPKALGATENPKTDAALTAASAASNFDETFSSVMDSELKSYSQSLKQAFTKTKSASERQLLRDEYSNAQLLLQQLNQAS